jgi:hypothetical protein
VNPRVLIPVVALVLACGAGVALYVVLSGPVPVEDSRTAATPPSTAPADTPVETPPPVAPAPTRRAPVPRAGAPAAAEPEPAVEAAPTLGTLRIDSDVPGAQVFIDRQFIGTTPVVAQDVAPGRHQLNVTAEGFEGFAESIEVEPGSRDIAIRFREVRLDASLDVVHRHGVGSCRGRLVATPQGLRYETTNRDDTFTSPLLDLETFEVDYLEKNLRVRLRGRQFNFTDPEGNADRLFVFHRDVNTARERLRKGDRPAGG